jgi:hypothetical protein
MSIRSNMFAFAADEGLRSAIDRLEKMRDALQDLIEIGTDAERAAATRMYEVLGAVIEPLAEAYLRGHRILDRGEALVQGDMAYCPFEEDGQADSIQQARALYGKQGFWFPVVDSVGRLASNFTLVSRPQ